MKPKSDLPPSRATALRAISTCLDKGRDLQAALDASLRASKPSPEDAALATELTYGFFRLRLRLEQLAVSHLKSPEKLPPGFIRILSLAALELTELDSIPAYASLDWAVNMLKKRHGRTLGGVANGVLRNIDRLGIAAREPAFYIQGVDDVTFLSRFYSCPTWIVEKWLAAYGPETTRAYLKAQISPPPLGLRVNLAHTGGRELLDSLTGNPNLIFQLGPALAFSQTPDLIDLAALQAQGLISRQSAASQEAILRQAPGGWPMPVWDSCSGRGGKAMLLTEQGLCPILASDIHMGRLRAHRAEANRLGHPTPPIFAARADSPAPFAAPMGTALLDVPCSGFGVLSRRPDTKYKRNPQDIQTLSALQNRILASAFDTIRPGGRLVYITCTLTPEENQLPLEHLLRTRRNAAHISTWDTPTDTPLNEFFHVTVVERASRT